MREKIQTKKQFRNILKIAEKLNKSMHAKLNSLYKEINRIQNHVPTSNIKHQQEERDTEQG